MARVMAIGPGKHEPPWRRGVSVERQARAGAWVAGRALPLEAPPLLTRRPGGNTVTVGAGSAGAALAAEMAAAIAREPGAAGKYDVARRCYIREEQRLLPRVAAGSPRAFHSLDALRKGPLYFPPTISEGVVDYGARAAPGYAMRRDGDFALGVSRQGDAISDHPATRGALPVVVSARDVPRPSARPTTSGEGATTARAAEGRERMSARPTTSGARAAGATAADWRAMPTARPLPEGWLKVRSRSRPGLGYYYDGATNTSTWKRPCTAPAPA